MSKGALFYILHKVSQAGVWPIVLIFAATSLNKQEQGLFFAMLSFGAFQALAEFGVNAGLIHFLSHEAASRSDRSIFHEVDISRFGRVREIILKSLRWTFFFGGAIACGMVFLGAWFFQAKDYGVSRQDWLAPWIFYCLSIFINLIYLNLKSVAEGVGNLFGSQLSAVVGVLCGGGAMIHSLWVGLGLYALPIGLMVNSVVGLLVVSISVRKWLCAALKSDPGETESGFDWWAEFWPHQWRLVASCGLSKSGLGPE